MPMDRRQLLQYSPSFLLASFFPPFAASASAAKADLTAALLIPQTGPHAALGRSMERAAMLAQATNAQSSLVVFDTGGTPEGAAAAASLALKKRASVILGPLMAGEVPGVAAAVGGTVPVISFSNDANLRESGAFLLGITARQSVRAILQYASDRGIRRVAVGGTDHGWGGQVRAAAEVEGTALGLAVSQLPGGDLSTVPGNVVGSADGLPDAVLMPDIPGLVKLAPQLASNGIQPLAALPELDLPREIFRQLEGTWLAAPDPAGFANFARQFEQRMGTRPGIIAALAFDAAGILNQMQQSGGLDRSAVLTANGFNGVCGHVRFREDGSAARSLTILELAAGGIRKIASPQPA